MIKTIRYLSAFSLFFFALSTHADNFYPSHRAQYVSLNIGSGYASKIAYFNQSVDGFDGVGGFLDIGEQVNHFFGPELSFQYNYYNAFAQYLAGGAAIRLTYSFTQQYNLFAKFGIGGAQVTTCANNYCVSNASVVPIFGAGFGAYITPRWMGSLEFNGSYYPHSSDANVQGVLGTLTVGITHFFSV